MEEGNILLIDSVEYEVLQINEEIDWVDPDTEEVIGRHKEVQLHKMGATTLLPTHLLKIYSADKVVFYKMIHSSAEIPFLKPKRKCFRVELDDEKRILLKDIKIYDLR